MAACSSDASPPSAAASASIAPLRRPGPSADLSTVLTGGNGMFLGSSSPIVLPQGWVEEERSASGTATSYRADSLPVDGRFEFSPDASAAYNTRIVIRRPPDAAQFNGTVVVEWLNVSGGLDGAPEYSFMQSELDRGYAWVGVSAQFVGVEGGPVLTPVPASAGIAGKGLRTIDPARYGTLHHPGDGFAFDIYTQIARALANGDGLGDLHPDRVLAVGESQSAAMLVAYTNGVQPLAHAFDGLLIHSRGAGAGPIAKPGEPVDVIAAFSGSPTVIRDDLDVPVFVMNTETDVAVLGASRSRQEDTDRFRLWEIAGAAHADRTNLGFTADAIDCGGPVNDGPQQFVARAALRSLDHWVRDGTLPVHADPLTLGGDPATAQRDGDGIILGGIRTPVVDVPTVVLSGEPRPATALVCLLSGKTDPIPTDRLAQRYPSRAAYLDEYTKSTDATIDRGFLLPEDRAAMLDKAQPDLIPG